MERDGGDDNTFPLNAVLAENAMRRYYIRSCEAYIAFSARMDQSRQAALDRQSQRGGSLSDALVECGLEENPQLVAQFGKDATHILIITERFVAIKNPDRSTNVLFQLAKKRLLKGTLHVKNYLDLVKAYGGEESFSPVLLQRYKTVLEKIWPPRAPRSRPSLHEVKVLGTAYNNANKFSMLPHSKRISNRALHPLILFATTLQFRDGAGEFFMKAVKLMGAGLVTIDHILDLSDHFNIKMLPGDQELIRAELAVPVPGSAAIKAAVDAWSTSPDYSVGLALARAAYAQAIAVDAAAAVSNGGDADV